MVNAGLIAEQPAYLKTLVQPVAYAAHQQPSSSQSFTKTVSYSQPKAYISQPATYQSYEPAHQYAVSSYHQEPEHHVYASPAYGHYEHGSSEQNIIRSAHGTVSHISKAVDTPHSSVRKYDTRVINDGYKTVQYAQPAYVAQQTAYVAQPAIHSYSPVLAKTAVVAQPLVHKTLAQPIIAKTIVSQPTQYHQYVAQPQYQQAYAAQPQYQTYAQHTPVLASKVHYSPAIEVAHASFESPVAHYSW